MSEYGKLKETLSALMDDEAGKVDQLELRRLARSLDSHPELVDMYQRYTLVHATLKGETTNASTDFLASIRTALDAEKMDDAPAVLSRIASVKQDARRQPENATHGNWLKVAGRVAVAASVAVIAVYLLQPQLPELTPGNAITGVATVQTPVVAPTIEHNNRLLDPNVLTVSAGDLRPFEHPVNSHSATSTGCVIDMVRQDNTNLVWEKDLPAGYALCKQGAGTKQCESVSSKLGCYLD